MKALIRRHLERRSDFRREWYQDVPLEDLRRRYPAIAIRRTRPVDRKPRHA